MQIDFDVIFSIQDPASAELMMLKAACLWNAGVIDTRQKQIVEQRAQKFFQYDKALQATSRTIDVGNAPSRVRAACRGLQPYNDSFQM